MLECSRCFDVGLCDGDLPGGLAGAWEAGRDTLCYMFIKSLSPLLHLECVCVCVCVAHSQVFYQVCGREHTQALG